jgi:hypothetical protein
MNAKQTGALKNLVNASGYLFQLAVEEVLRTIHSSYPFEPIVREHPWKDIDSGQQGFIDLVAGYKGIRFVIECKRPRDGVWVFVVPQDKNKKTSRCRCRWSDYSPGLQDLSGFDDFGVFPVSLESDICIIRGQGEHDRALLERITGTLLASVDALADEELELCHRLNRPESRIFIPLIVTAAELRVCTVDVSKIQLADGTIDDVHFDVVPLIRFRKSLTTGLSADASPESLLDANRDRERTILVVNALHLSEVLSNWDTKTLHPWGGYPWDSIRKRMALEQK